MEDEIYRILQDTPNVYEGWYRENIKENHVTFFTYNTSPRCFSDCDYENINNSVQIDVWGTDVDEVRKTEKEVRKLLKENEFTWIEGNRDFETDTGLFHYANRFNYLADADD
ncbi:hypothetical protein FDG50_00335 [Clostridium botulinum]|uniref:hypothetical protein n=1 Tax=Clostridium botulinum TaxID=1491 RepID=UPI0013FE729E|nr:hypothetical protein [Clostridium botulinum]MBY6835976.1 hypothetical protein [Clostridium botulinum]MBY6929805.1 hypothetical protein [Clostridium botulinum]NFG65759.1 hypothetical protein [Clostridium botulinum]NFQ22595.1 hypothetical protein [Clostridium botulinum]